MHLLKVHRVYNTYVHLEFKSEKIGGHSSEAANQVEPLCAPPKTPDQLSTHLKKSSSALYHQHRQHQQVHNSSIVTIISTNDDIIIAEGQWKQG